jgi:cytochrome c biogenesis protein CcmG/thiol:disulfide interchange protein DsbE
MGRHPARWGAVAVGVVLVVFIAVLATRPSIDERGISSAILGKPVPKVAGSTLAINGQPAGTFDIDRYRGRWVVVNFFASWCGPCQLEHPELVKFTEEHSGGDVVVVSLVFNDSDAAIEKFFAERGGSWPVIGGDGTAKTALDFGVTGVPESYVISPDGIVVAKFDGVTASDLDQFIGSAVQTQ